MRRAYAARPNNVSVQIYEQENLSGQVTCVFGGHENVRGIWQLLAKEKVLTSICVFRVRDSTLRFLGSRAGCSIYLCIHVLDKGSYFKVFRV